MARRFIVPGVHIEEEQKNIPKNLVQEARSKTNIESISKDEAGKANTKDEKKEGMETPEKLNQKQKDIEKKKQIEKILEPKQDTKSKELVQVKKTKRNTQKEAEKISIENKLDETFKTVQKDNQKNVGNEVRTEQKTEKTIQLKQEIKDNKNTKAVPTKTSKATKPSQVQALEKKQNLVIVGEATRGGWNTKRGQKFKQTALNKFEITIYLKANKEYLILPTYQDWDNKWATQKQEDIWQGIFDKQGLGSNFKAPDKTGKYRIELDFSQKKFTYKLIRIFI